MSVRISTPPGWSLVEGGCDGFASKKMVNGINLLAVTSWGLGWDHVSVSTARRCPTWDEMALVARAFFEPGDTLMQLMVPESDHVNIHPFCLHWWRPQQAEIPRPPSMMVGPTIASA